jgi:cobyrinic acid a,c-diamide synthase
MQHRAATGRPSINLDSWLLGREELVRSFQQLSATCDVALVEGSMGLFDGQDHRSEEGSTAQVAKWVGAPVVLVMDAWSVGRSAAAIIKGYQQFDQGLRLCGVLFNRITDGEQLQHLRDALDGTGVGLPVVGGVPKVRARQGARAGVQRL